MADISTVTAMVWDASDLAQLWYRLGNAAFLAASLKPRSRSSIGGGCPSN
jgi:hypothetical protein